VPRWLATGKNEEGRARGTLRAWRVKRRGDGGRTQWRAATPNRVAGGFRAPIYLLGGDYLNKENLQDARKCSFHSPAEKVYNAAREDGCDAQSDGLNDAGCPVEPGQQVKIYDAPASERGNEHGAGEHHCPREHAGVPEVEERSGIEDSSSGRKGRQHIPRN